MPTWLIAISLLLGKPSISGHERVLFNKSIGQYLTRDSWTEPLAYLHGHFFMVPLHTAMLSNDQEWRGKFEAQLKRLSESDRSTWATNPLSRAQYMYIGTRYLALLAQTNQSSEFEGRLADLLGEELHDRWTNQEAIMWGRGPFGGVKARIDYKLALVNPARSYYKAITDEEFFLFAEAADLLAYHKAKGTRAEHESTFREMMGYAVRIMRTEGVFTEGGGWLFQVGVWRDHPDNNYSANTELAPGMVKRSHADVTMDSSHFHRFARFLGSFESASGDGGADEKFFAKARRGLAKQLKSVVLTAPSESFGGVKLTNYMNGWNGVYRFDSNKAVGEGKGYGPYQLSGTFLIGWWSFLGDLQVQADYANQANRFPLSESVLKTYLGPTYSEPPRAAKSWYENGLAELLCSLASKMPVEQS